MHVISRVRGYPTCVGVGMERTLPSKTLFKCLCSLMREHDRRMLCRIRGGRQHLVHNKKHLCLVLCFEYSCRQSYRNNSFVDVSK